MKLLLTHNDPDGVLSAALVLRKFKDLEIDFTVPKQLNSKLASFVNKYDNRELLIITDLGGNQDSLYLSAIWKKVYWLDHHDWTWEEIPKRVTLVVKKYPSATQLVNEFFNIGDNKIVKIANELDTNNVKSEEAKKLRALLYGWRKDFDMDIYHLKIAKLAREIAEEGLNALNKYEEIIKLYDKQYNEQYSKAKNLIETIKPYEIEGYKVYLIETKIPSYIVSEAIKDKDWDILIIARPNKNGYRYELRSKEFPVINICKALNGGGHKVACGVTSNIKPEEFIKIVERFIKVYKESTH